MLHILNMLTLYLFIVLNKDERPHFKNTLFNSNFVHFDSKYARKFELKIELNLSLSGI